MHHRILLVTLLLGSVLAAQDWPVWRGPSGDGTAPAGRAPREWAVARNVKWKVPLHRPANGSPIVVGGRVFLTMAEDEEGKRRSLYCYDRESGRKLWARTVEFGRAMPTHDTNPYCGSTPASDGQRVFVWHASAGLHCYDLEGKPLWRRDFGEFRHQWGYGTSPTLHDGKLILNTGPGKQAFVTALDPGTGTTIWRTDEPNHLDAEAIRKKRLAGSWSTPVIARVGGGTELVCPQATRIVGYDPEDGKVLWWCKGLSSERGDLVYSSPVIADDVCVVVGGYDGPSIGVRLGGRGDVTESHRLWLRPKTMSNCASGIAVDGHVYVPDMNGFVHCIDAKTGEQKWRERAGRGRSWGSIIHADGRLYLMLQSGTTVVFRPDPERLEILSRNEIDERTNATPVILDGQVFIRTHRNLYCIAQEN